MLLAGLGSTTTAEFSLSGTTRDLADGTVLQLSDSQNNNVLGNAVVRRGKFQFEFDLPSSPLYAILHTKDWSNYRHVWLESGPMFFSGANSDFKDSVISGSATENLNQSLTKKTKGVPRNEKHKLEAQFIEDNPDSVVSAHILSVYATSWGKDRTNSLFEKFSQANQASFFGRQIAKFIELNNQPAVGDAFIDFELPDATGREVKLSSVSGKIILLKFWASNCAPCMRELPELKEIYADYRGDDFEVYAVSLDTDSDNWLRAVEKYQLNWINVSDLQGDASLAGLIYGVAGIPDSFLINRDGLVVARGLRGKKLREKLSELTSQDSIEVQNTPILPMREPK